MILAKSPSQAEVFNDLFIEITNLYRVVRDDDKRDELLFLLHNTPYSRPDFDLCIESLKLDEPPKSDAWRAWRYLVVSRLGWAGVTSGLKRFVKADMSGGMSRLESRMSRWPVGEWEYLLKSVADRFRNVVIENRDFRRLIPSLDSPSTLFYCDPPYVISDRARDEETYKHEMTDSDHVEFANLVHNSKGMFAISGYHGLYDTLFADWECKEIVTPAYVSDSNLLEDGRRTSRTECLWLSPSCLINSQLRLF